MLAAAILNSRSQWLNLGRRVFPVHSTQSLLFDAYNFWTLEQPMRVALPLSLHVLAKNATQGTLCVICCSDKNNDSDSNLTERETGRGKGVSSGVFI